MKKLLTLEEFAQFIASLYFLYGLPISFNYLVVVLAFFAPDLFAIGYLISRPVGAILYNFSHHKLTAIAVIFIGIVSQANWVIAAGLITYSHSSFDRMIGYGLKYLDSPGHTHLGYIGKEKFKNEPDHF